MRSSRLILAAALALVGIVWIGQGTGALAGSAMSGTAFWAAAGAVLVVLAVVLVVRERRMLSKGSRPPSG